MTNFLKVQGNDSLVRDTRTKAIVNTNNVEYQNYINQRDSAKSRKEQIQKNTEDINNIKQDLSEIKQLLLSLLNK